MRNSRTRRSGRIRNVIEIDGKSYAPIPAEEDWGDCGVSRGGLRTGQPMDFHDVEKKVSQSGSELVELHAAVRQLQARVDRHSLVIQVLKEMLLSQAGFSEDGFLERLERTVAQKADDKTCRKCGKAMSAKHNRCMYCGEQRPPELL